MPTIVRPRSWKNTVADKLAHVKEILLRAGAIEDKNLKNPHEAWRVRLEGTVFTAYTTGTLYCNGGELPELTFLYEKVSEALDQALEQPDAKVLIGLDETGKGEVLGHSALAAVVIQSQTLKSIDSVISSVDTKTRKEFGFWDSLIEELDAFRGRGLDFDVETVPPWDVDRYNINKILDVVYQRLLSRALRGVDPQIVRVTIDDYGVGRNLDEYLESLQAAGAEVRVETKADTRYVEVRAASVVAKWRRELAMKRIAERFSLPGTPVGSGNAGDPDTKAWLAAWKATGKPWPWFVKISYRTIRELDGRAEPIQKVDPPIRHELLSRDSAERFREGRLSTASLTIVCPLCGNVSGAAKLTPGGPTGGLVGRCLGCGEIIRNLETTLRYYCGLVLPDSSVIIAGTLSKDLESHGFFGGFTLVLPTVVNQESDTAGGRSELAKLGDFAAMGRISMFATTSEVPADSTERDVVVVKCAQNRDAILVTRDGGMYGNAIANHVFCLTFKGPTERAGASGS
jgi:ribonuclease HII